MQRASGGETLAGFGRWVLSVTCLIDPPSKKHGVTAGISVQMGLNKQVGGYNKALNRGLNATLRFSEPFNDHDNGCSKQFSLLSSAHS